jgi:hypothetical protein
MRHERAKLKSPHTPKANGVGVAAARKDVGAIGAPCDVGAAAPIATATLGQNEQRFAATPNESRRRLWGTAARRFIVPMAKGH